jgi:enoyl-CoA hydratase/carnithine racemase
MEESCLDFERDGPIAILRINRPTRLNAINGAVLAQLLAAVKEIKRDESLRVFLLTGAPREDGRPCFSAGDDLKEAEAGQMPPGNPGYRLTNLIDDCWKPSIAVIDGICTTGALELALACDLRVVAETARISDWHLKRLGSGLGGWGASTRLPRLVGLAHAKHLILTGAEIDGNEAHRIGLANRVHPSERLWPEAMAMARSIAQMPPSGVRQTMALLGRTMDLSKEESLGLAKQVREWMAPERDFGKTARSVLESISVARAEEGPQ